MTVDNLESKILNDPNLSNSPESLGISFDVLQKTSETRLRKNIAWAIMAACFGQIIFIDVVFFLIGIGAFSLKDSQLYTLIASTLIELLLLINMVFNYLFPQAKGLLEQIVGFFKPTT